MRKQLWKRGAALVLAFVMAATSIPLNDALIVHAEESTDTAEENVELVNIASDAEVTVPSEQGGASGYEAVLADTNLAKFTDGVTFSGDNGEAVIYFGSVNASNDWLGTPYKTQYPDETEPFDAPWVKFDFGEVKDNIQKILVYGREDSGYNGTFSHDCSVFISDDGTTWTQVGETTRLYRMSPGQTYTVDLTEDPQTARYVVVRMDMPTSEEDSSYSQECRTVISEVEIYQEQVVTEDSGDDDTTLTQIDSSALSASSPNGNGENDPSYATDGNVSTHWQSATLSSAEDFEFLITLDGIYTLQQLDYTKRYADGYGYECHGYLNNYQILTSIDGQNYTEAVSGDTSGATTEIDLSGVVAKYIKIKSTSLFYMSGASEIRATIAELAVYGEKSEATQIASDTLSASSPNGNGENDPSYATDGNVSTHWQSATLSSAEDFEFIITLDGFYALQQLDYTKRYADGYGYECHGYLEDYQILTSVDGVTYTQTASGDTSGATTAIALDGTVAKYIKIKSTSLFYMSGASEIRATIAELAVYGIQAESYVAEEVEETPASAYPVITDEATITSDGTTGTYWTGPEYLYDGLYDSNHMYKFHAAALDSEKYVRLTYDEARDMDLFHIAFEQKETDSEAVVFNYSIKATAADGTETYIVQNATANKTDNWEQYYKIDEAEYQIIDIIMHSCTHSGGNAWPAIAEFEVYGKPVSDYPNITSEAEITSDGATGTWWTGPEYLYDGLYDSSHMYKFHAAALDSEKYVRLAYDEARKMDLFHIAFEHKDTDSDAVVFNYSIKVTAADGTETYIVENATANKTDKWEQYYKFEEAEYATIDIIMHSCTYSGGNAWPAIAEFEVFGEELVIEDPDSVAWGKVPHVAFDKENADSITDGNRENSWTADYYPTYADIDLEANYDITEIQVFTPADGYSQYTIYTSMDGRNYTEYAAETDTEPVTDVTVGDSHAKEATARYIRVYMEYNSASTKAILNEVRVLGELSEDQTDQTADPVEVSDFDETAYAAGDAVTEVQGIITRQLGAAYVDWFTFEIAENPVDGHTYDYFAVSMENGKVHIEGNNGVSLATGLNHYLKYYCNVHISQVGNQVTMPAAMPEVEAEGIFKETKAEVRYSYNYCTNSYSMAFWGEDEWRQELDWLALNGVNVVLDLTGQEEVWRRFLGELGYTHEEIKDFIAGPAYYAWAYMANLSGFGGPIHDSWFTEKTELARKNQQIMRTLGMEPVLQGYSGMIPTDIATKTPENTAYQVSEDDILEQGTWNAFQRPAMLNTDTETFTNFASLFYQCQKEVYGDAKYYATDPFHEGGIRPTDLTEEKIAELVLTSMLDADEDAVWIIQSWHSNPTSDLMNGLDAVTDGPSHALVLDLYAERNPHYGEDRGGVEFGSTPWIFCMLNNFGGRLGLHGHLSNLSESVANAFNNTTYINGIGITPEASENNPVLYDYFFELIWQDDASAEMTAKDENAIKEWLQSYTARRYGKTTDSVDQAWTILLETAYNAELSNTAGGEGAPESIVNALPRTGGIGAASTWGYSTVYYDKLELEKAAKLLLEDYDELKESEAYLYDVATVVQQVLANSAQEYYNKMDVAITAKDAEAFEAYSATFMEIIECMETTTSTTEYYSLGRWIEQARALAEGTDDFTEKLYEFNARALITTWGTYDHANGGLRDYSNRQWSGLIEDFYQARWQMWLEGIDTTTWSTPSINWFEWEWNWVRDSKDYPTEAANVDMGILGPIMIDEFTVAEFIDNEAADDTYDIDRELLTASTGSIKGSEGDAEGPASNVLDDNQSTIWSTSTGDSEDFVGEDETLGGWISLEMKDGSAFTVDGLRYLPRSENPGHGKIKEFEIYVKLEGSDEYVEVAALTGDTAFDTSNQWYKVKFDPIENVVSVKLKAITTTSYDGSKDDQHATAAEIRLTTTCLHKTREFVDAVPKTCVADGTIEHWVCTMCGVQFAGETDTEALESITDPEQIHDGTHNYVYDNGTRCGCGYVENVGKYSQASISIEGDIIINFHMTLEETITDKIGSADIEMTFADSEGEVSAPVALTSDLLVNGEFIFPCNMAAKEMNDIVTATLKEGDTTLATIDYSVKKYADSILTYAEENSEQTLYSAEVITLVESMLNYGGYSQKYFEYNAANPANSEVALKLQSRMDDVTASTENLVNCKKTRSGEVPTSLKYYGSGLVLKSKTMISHYFTVEDGKQASDYEVTLTRYDGEALGSVTEEHYISDGYFYIDIMNISAENLDVMYSVTIRDTKADDSKEWTINMGAYAYIRSVLNNPDKFKLGDELENAMKALYLYGEDAQGYKDSLSQSSN